MKVFHIIGLVVLLSVNGLAALAQSATSLPLPELDEEQSQRWVVKFAPLTLFDPDNTVQFGIERLFGQHNAVHVEAGYGWQGINLWRNSQSQRYTDQEIWRGRVEWRYYLRKTNRPLGRYIAIEGFYKQLNALESGTLGIGCSSGSCQYYQLVSSPIYKYVWGSHIKFGRQFSVDQNGRWLVDVYTGLGMRWRNVDRYQPPSDVYYYRSSGAFLFDTFYSTSYAIVSLAYGVKIGYSF